MESQTLNCPHCGKPIVADIAVGSAESSVFAIVVRLVTGKKRKAK